MARLLGKMLRIDIDSPPAENSGGICALTQNDAVPPDNPFVGTPGACDEIWYSGLRNPYRWSFDRSTDDLLMGDVGKFAQEEMI